MIIIDEKQFGNHSILEIVEQQHLKEKLPIVIFYHGWTDYKDYGVSMGVQLAKRGMRVIIPDQLFHGNRAEQPLQGLEIWQIIGANVQEFPELVNYYRHQGLVDEQKIAVAGYSMGGMTVYVLVKHFPEITAAVSLMGNPNPIQFAEWSLTSIWMQDKVMPSNVEELWAQMLPQLTQLSLAAEPQKIAGRALLIWHGTEDDKVPYDLNHAFYESIKDEEYAKQVEWLETVGAKHIVPFSILEQSADFLAKHLGTKGE